MAVFFPRKRFGWGPPTAWQGWVFLGLWCVSFAAVTSREPTVATALGSLALIVFLIGVASVEEK